jgi:serine/threonine protein kinase
MVKLYQYFEARSGCVFLMLEYIKGGRLVDFIQANRHHWGHPVPPSHEASPVPPTTEDSLKVSQDDSVGLDHQLSFTSSVDSENYPRPPLVIDPPTPTQGPSIDPNESLPEIETSMEGVLSPQEEAVKTGNGLHFSPTPRSGSRQASPSASPRTSRTSILEKKLKMWTAQIIIALESLHSHGIVCGDLNTRNILITQDGEARLTFFGRWQGIDHRSDPHLYERHFIAPELYLHYNPIPASDFWSLGVILFELLCGRSFTSCHPGGLHTHLPLSIPNSDHISPEAQSILKKLLQVSSRERLGAGLAGIEELKSHTFFNGVDWESLQSRAAPEQQQHKHKH